MRWIVLLSLVLIVGAEDVRLNSSDIHRVVMGDLLLRDYYSHGIDEVNDALSFFAHSIDAQRGLPWVTSGMQAASAVELTQAFAQLPLYPTANFLPASGQDVYVAAVPEPWRIVKDALLRYKLVSNTGKACPEYTNRIYDTTRHASECVVMDGIKMTVDCESESAPTIFSIVALSLMLVIAIAALIVAVIANVRTQAILERSEKQLETELIAA
jgi:hypothetical protein